MDTIVDLYSSKPNEIYKFLNKFYNKDICNKNVMKWEKVFNNPIEIADIIGVFIDNNDKYSINMWVSLDNGFFLNITDNNVNQIIKYLFERYPY